MTLLPIPMGVILSGELCSVETQFLRKTSLSFKKSRFFLVIRTTKLIVSNGKTVGQTNKLFYRRDLWWRVSGEGSTLYSSRLVTFCHSALGTRRQNWPPETWPEVATRQFIRSCTAGFIQSVARLYRVVKKPFLLSSENHSQNVLLPTPNMHYGAKFQPMFLLYSVLSMRYFLWISIYWWSSTCSPPSLFFTRHQ